MRPVSRAVAWILTLAVIFSLAACGGSKELSKEEKAAVYEELAAQKNEEVLNEILAADHLELEEAQELIGSLPPVTEELRQMKFLVDDLLACEGLYVQEREEDDYTAYTAKLNIYLVNGVPYCATDYTNYMGLLVAYPAPVTRTEEPGYLFYTEPTDESQVFQIYFGEERMHITWGDGICDYMLTRWSGDPAELENTPFQETEDYDFVVSLLDSFLGDISHRYHYDSDTKTLTVVLYAQYGARNAVLADKNQFADLFEQMSEPLEKATDTVQSYLDICLSDYGDPFSKPHCEVLFVDHLKDGDQYDTDDIILKVRDGRTTIDITKP